MQKTPTYIGIFASQPKNAANKLKDYSRECLQQLMSQVNSMFVMQDFNAFDEKFKMPKDNYHITTLYIGGNENALKGKQKQCLKTFKNDVKVPIKIQLCVYVPGIIMTGYCSDTGGIECDNAHPHVTLMLGGQTKAMESNAVLDLLFKGNPDILKEQFTLKQAKQKYNGKSIFVIKKQITVDGVTGDNFKHGARK